MFTAQKREHLWSRLSPRKQYFCCFNFLLSFAIKKKSKILKKKTPTALKFNRALADFANLLLCLDSAAADMYCMWTWSLIVPDILTAGMKNNRIIKEDFLFWLKTGFTSYFWGHNCFGQAFCGLDIQIKWNIKKKKSNFSVQLHHLMIIVYFGMQLRAKIGWYWAGFGPRVSSWWSLIFKSDLCIFNNFRLMSIIFGK